MLQEFIKTYKGKRDVGNTPDNKGECVGLVSVWMDEFNIPHVWGHAKDLFNNAPDKYFEKIKNGKSAYPIAGDIMVWDGKVGGGFGHTAVVTDSSSKDDTFTVFEQNNWAGDNDPSCEITTYKDWYGVIGWLRIKGYKESDPCEEKIKSLEDSIKELREQREQYRETIKKKDAEIEKLNKKLNEKGQTDKFLVLLRALIFGR